MFQHAAHDGIPQVRQINKSALLVIAFGLIALVAAGSWYLNWQAARHRQDATATQLLDGNSHQTLARRAAYPAPPAITQLNHRDDALLKKLQDELLDLKGKTAAEMALLRAQLAAKAKEPPPAPKAAQPIPTTKPHITPLPVGHHELASDKTPLHPTPTFALAPGTWLNCAMVSATNSDIQGHFVAETTTRTYDSQTGQHLLIPAGAPIVGVDQANTLLFGHERLPMTTLTLGLPNGKSVELGSAPMTDAAGAMGLTDKVNNHWGRAAFGALFLGGTRGVAQAVQQEAGMVGPAGQVASGIAQSGNQAVQSREGRTIDTRPTITVRSGKGCAVLLVKGLELEEIQE